MKLALSKLKEVGTGKVYLMIMVENECVKIFYHKTGFQNRKDITLVSSKSI